ncbi:phage integrase, N-terminal SAM-like domain protein [Orientia tsutsugamushi str. UT76]|nr:phage integrase, N-terminal SAM-like domain protein [Orientia tsutsugamushi str. UT76]
MQLNSQLKKIITEWLNHLKNYKNYSINTCSSYNNDLQQFLNFIVDYCNLSELKISHLCSVDIRLMRSWLSKDITFNIILVQIVEHYLALEIFTSIYLSTIIWLIRLYVQLEALN